MLRLRSYLRPYAPMLVATIILLFAQAMLDLALPGYLADIVNKGVQLSGIESAVSEAVSQQRMEQLTLFINSEDEAAVRNAYTLVQAGSPEASDYVETFPVLADQSIYIRNDLLGDNLSQDEIDQLNAPMARSWMIVSALEQAMANPEAAAQMFGTDG
ncbi:MAG: hypothetical protein ACK2UP_21145, partial [Candidatus Promineifilaceae bacterium]